MNSDRPPVSLIPLLRWPAEKKRRRVLEGLLGPTAGLRCLDIGGADGGLGWFLRQQGGDWSSIESEESAQQALATLIGTPVRSLDEGRIPFDNEMFDVVVVADRLETRPDDEAFVRECHRVLKPAGRLIVHTSRASRAARAVSKSGEKGTQPARAGYTEADLFMVLKDGFDVQDVQSYGRFFSAWADRLGWSFVEKSADPGRVVRWATFPVWLVSLLDGFLFFTRGRRLALRAKRRLWIPRNRPVLRDGRSIAEATLKTRIGSASPLAAAKRPNP